MQELVFILEHGVSVLVRAWRQQW